MSDDKKRDDYAIDIPQSKESSFRAPSPSMRSSPARPLAAVTENPMLAILGYCGSSILMTVTNKYVLSGVDYNLNFFLLCVQVSYSILSSIGSANSAVGRRLCGCDFNLQEHGHYHIPGLQQ
jgi:GDP-mannose transporter